jgi:hypothetical protein
MSVEVAEYVALSTGTGRITDRAADVAGASAAVRIANGIDLAHHGIATVWTADCTGVAATEWAAFRVRAARRAQVAAAKRVALLTFRVTARVRIANHIASGPFALWLTNAAKGARVTTANGAA